MTKSRKTVDKKTDISAPIHQKVTYKILLRAKERRSEVNVMLCELIDNSIASWENNKSKLGNLKVELRLNQYDNEVIVQDNAAGMSREELINALMLAGEVKKVGINKNGVGLKDAAFWLGRDLTIRTNNGASQWEVKILTDKMTGSQLNKVFEYEPKTGKYVMPLRGTEVVIGSIDKSPRKIFSEDFVKEFCEFLGYKYFHFLKAASPSVSIKIVLERKNEEAIDFEVIPKSITAQEIPRQRLKSFESFLEEGYKRAPKILRNIKELAIERAKSGLPLIFNFPIEFKFLPNTQVRELTIGVISKDGRSQFRDSYGIIAYEHGRAIRLPPKSIEFSKEYTRSDIKRAFGSIDLTGIFEPDMNKSDFKFDEFKEDWETLLNDVAADFLPLCEAVKKTLDKDNLQAENNDLFQNQVAETTKGPQIASISSKGSQEPRDAVLINIQVPQSEWQLNFTITAGNSSLAAFSTSNKMIDIKEVYYSEPKISLAITINMSHKIWRRLSSGNESETFPVICTFAIYMCIRKYSQSITHLGKRASSKLVKLGDISAEEIYESVVSAF